MDAVNKYQKWNEQYGSNPLKAVQPWAEQQFPTIVKQQVDAALGSYRREQAVNQLIQGNADWMYAKDQFGNPQVGQNGRYVPTPNGIRYGQYVQELERSGITDPYTVDRYAKAHLQADIAAQAQRAAGNQRPQLRRSTPPRRAARKPTSASHADLSMHQQTSPARIRQG